MVVTLFLLCVISIAMFFVSRVSHGTSLFVFPVVAHFFFVSAARLRLLRVTITFSRNYTIRAAGRASLFVLHNVAHFSFLSAATYLACSEDAS